MVTNMNRKTPTKASPLKLYGLLSLCATLIAVILRSLNLFLYYEDKIGYYERGSVLPVLTRILITAFILSFAVFVLVAWRKKSPALDSGRGANRVAAWLCALLFGAFAVFSAVHYFQSGNAFSGAVKQPLILALVSLTATVFFVLYAMKKGTPSLLLLLGFGTILWFVLILAVSYFDATVAMNSPFKLIQQLACLGAMLLVLGETRILCGAPKSRLYLFSLSTASLFLCTSSLPSLIYDFSIAASARPLSMTEPVCLGVGIFAVVRLILLTFGKDPEESITEPTEVTDEKTEEPAPDAEPGVDPTEDIEKTELPESDETANGKNSTPDENSDTPKQEPPDESAQA